MSLHIYSCSLSLMENLFFSSREINTFFQTEPLIGNYALCYALSFCQAPYHSEGEIYYKKHLSELNEKGIYVTPATIVGEPKFAISQFNAQSDTYWYKFVQNAISVYRNERTRAVNFPQFGKIKSLALGNEAVFYIISREDIRDDIPSYIRLGKFMSKAKLDVEESEYKEVEEEEITIDIILNPNDLSHPEQLRIFQMYNIHPSPLIRYAVLSGRFYKLKRGTYLPMEMRFGVSGL